MGYRQSQMRILKLALAMTVFVVTAPVATASSDTAALEKFYGVWIGRGIVVEERAKRTVFATRDIDVAIWESETGFDITWRNVSRDETTRVTIHFAAAREPDTFEVKWTDPPLSADERFWAQIEGDRLTVYLSGVDDDVERVARYECSVSDGHMTFKYTLSRGGELLETVTSNLYRAKVVM